MEKKLDRIEEMVGTLIKMVGNLSSDLKETKDHLKEIESKVDAISEGQERQDRIIEKYIC
jgi:archaellum component FlaC